LKHGVLATPLKPATRECQVLEESFTGTGRLLELSNTYVSLFRARFSGQGSRRAQVPFIVYFDSKFNGKIELFLADADAAPVEDRS
jgi:hypothetical protein